MDKIKCQYCGTEYDEDLELCPLCGVEEDIVPAPVVTKQVDTTQEEPAPRTSGGSRVAPNRSRRGGSRTKERQDRIPTWMAALICIILTLALAVGGWYLLNKSGILEKEEPETTGDSLTLPYEEGDTTEEKTPTVDGSQCEALSLDYGEFTMFDVGETVPLKANVVPESAAPAVVWTVDNPAVCTVDGKGVVTAVAGGTAVVTATCGTQSASCIVRCVMEAAEETDDQSGFETTETTTPTTTAGDATLNITDFTLFNPGETAQVTVKNAPADAEVVWSVANSAVATVDDDGLVTGVKAGTTKVTAKVGDQELTCIVRCNMETGVDVNSGNADGEDVESGSLELSHTDATIIPGETFTITVSGTTASPSFSVGNSNVCTVSASGTVTGIGSGTTNITVEVGGETMTCVVRIN